jgi:hypothetical protein
VAAELRQAGTCTNLRVVDADPHARLVAGDTLPGHSNYLISNQPTKWLHRVPHASSLLARGELHRASTYAGTAVAAGSSTTSFSASVSTRLLSAGI